MKPKHKHFQAFTLVELSIVLVVIGLIVGGVVGGRTLVEQAKLNDIIKEYNAMKIAVQQFDMQYDGLPGDLPDATAWFGGTFNGDGNRRVDGWANESNHFHAQLDWAGFVHRQDSPIMTGAIYRKGPVEASIMYTHYNDIYGYVFGTPTGLRAQHREGNAITMHGNDDGNPGNIEEGFLIPSDAKHVDKKIDDGLPQNGMVAGRIGNEGNCFADGADYLLSSDVVQCRLLMFLD